MSHSESPDRVLNIGGYRVAFVPGSGWQCNCVSWSAEQGCEHCTQAAALTTIERAVIGSGGSTTRH
jgi:hypothetical protein